MVSRQDPKLGEEDNLAWLKYSATTTEGARAILQSRNESRPIRVFRSSKLENTEFRLPPKHGEGPSAKYRYDGLYQVEKVYEASGKESGATKPDALVTHSLYTFLLRRAAPAPDGNLLDVKTLVEQSRRDGTMVKVSPPIVSPPETFPPTLQHPGQALQARASKTQTAKPKRSREESADMASSTSRATRETKAPNEEEEESNSTTSNKRVRSLVAGRKPASDGVQEEETSPRESKQGFIIPRKANYRDAPRHNSERLLQLYQPHP